MRKIILCAVAVISFTAVNAQVLIPNASFENYTQIGSNYTLNGGWTGKGLSRSQSITVNGPQGAQIRKAADGDWFLGIQNTISGNVGYTGCLINKFAITGKPRSMTFSLMYFASTTIMGEGWYASVLLWKNGGKYADTLAYTTVSSTSYYSNWVDVTFNLDYDPEFKMETPDSCMLVFGTLPNSQEQISESSVVFVDNLLFNDFSVSSAQDFSSLNKPQGVQVYPNPVANGTTTVSFALKTPADIEIELTDLAGKHLQTVLKEKKQEGEHEIPVDVSQLPAGVYMLTVKSGSFAETHKILVTK